MVVATKDVFCRDKHMFVATKMILVAALTNDRGEEEEQEEAVVASGNGANVTGQQKLD